MMCVVMSTLSCRAVALDLVSDLPSPQLLGTTIHWQVVDAPPVSDFRLMVLFNAPGETSHVMYDFSGKSTFEWTPMVEGSYVVSAVVRDAGGGTTTLNETFVVNPRAMSAPVLSTTRNPLVALYSAPACPAGRTMEVSFDPADEDALQTTNRKACDGVLTMNFLIGGMRAQTTYQLRHVLRNAQGVVVRRGPIRQFTAGAAPPGLTTVRPLTPTDPRMSLSEDVLLVTPNFTNGTGTAIATDLQGRLIWYYSGPESADIHICRLERGGNMLVEKSSDFPGDDSILREVDLASNILHETTATRVSEGLQALGQPTVTTFHHDAIRLANGHIIVLGSSERIYVDVQGPGAVDVMGDVIIDLDPELQPVWATNLYDILDVSRVAVLDEKCAPGRSGCPPLYLDDLANDWTHSNSLAYSPADGNIVFSSRHQDWIMKVDYRDGLGTGGLVWRLGREGDFTLAGTSNDGWFSHTHDAEYLGTDQIMMYDNGNANPDCLADPRQCASFGKVYRLDEVNRIATPVLDANLQNFSFAVGTAQRLSNGNYHFESGSYNGSFKARTHELTPTGEIIFEMEITARTYRAFRLRDLYTPPQY
jgi:hypothetical protein